MLTTNVKRRDFLMTSDITDGNPNADPDADSDPRRDDETGIGKITAECTKRKIRHATSLIMNGVAGYEMYVERGAILNEKIRECYEQAGVVIEDPNAKKKAKAKKGEKVEEVKVEEKELRVSREQSDKGNRRLCERYFDARWFGAVVTGVGTGRITGPLQLNMARSVLPIEITSVAGTRSATTNADQSKAQKGMNQNWVRRGIIPHAVFVQAGYLNPFQAKNTGFVEKDFETFLDALKLMYENDRSSCRGLMTLRQVVIFEHEDPLGNARAADLFKLVRVIPVNPGGHQSSFDDYQILIDHANVPAGVTIRTLYPEVTVRSEAAE
jgi:CRISPR-associated protein Csd2